MYLRLRSVISGAQTPKTINQQKHTIRHRFRSTLQATNKMNQIPGIDILKMVLCIKVVNILGCCGKSRLFFVEKGGAVACGKSVYKYPI